MNTDQSLFVIYSLTIVKQQMTCVINVVQKGNHIAPRKAKALSLSLSGCNRVESGGPFYLHYAVQLDSVPSRGICTTNLVKGAHERLHRAPTSPQGAKIPLVRWLLRVKSRKDE